MKTFLLTLFLVAGVTFSYDATAINSSAAPTVLPANSQITVNDFLSVDLKAYRTVEGKKLNLTQRIALNQFQKGLARKVNKGKIEGTATLNEVTRAGGANKMGLFSLIFSAVGLILLFTPVGLLGMALGIAGFVLGIIGLKKDADMTMALIGTILGGLVILLTLIAAIIVASWLSF